MYTVWYYRFKPLKLPGLIFFQIAASDLISQTNQFFWKVIKRFNQIILVESVPCTHTDQWICLTSQITFEKEVNNFGGDYQSLKPIILPDMVQH